MTQTRAAAVSALLLFASAAACSDEPSEPVTAASTTDSEDGAAEVVTDPRALGSSCERFAECNKNWVDGDNSTKDFKIALTFVTGTARAEDNDDIERDALAVAKRLDESEGPDQELGSAYERLVDSCREEIDDL